MGGGDYKYKKRHFLIYDLCHLSLTKKIPLYNKVEGNPLFYQ